ncbi:hypothetical protein [Niastella populi]|uniref:P pilus assembly/Cpx signaling pathway, periplasmic inhibitor/zinc-resistance associated protein n=1 Tax=Niastella populi TaxID=550983 RepID=A0A1V9F0S8_9BACT|nr:hypothetical protein [Niastella populi]OQP51950.1 hypothetical protein A4R26_29050 [Niastella populi]
MKWVLILLPVLLLGRGIAANAQQRFFDLNGKERLRLRLNELKLSDDQKRRIAIIIRRQRMQELKNQQELDEILTGEQKALLQDWRKRRFETNSKDSVAKKQKS